MIKKKILPTIIYVTTLSTPTLQAQTLSYLFPNDLMHPFSIDFFVWGGRGGFFHYFFNGERRKENQCM
jgi:hypothetical protein